MNRISLCGLTNVLSPKEMKNVKGGSDAYHYCTIECYDCNGSYTYSGNCAFTECNDCFNNSPSSNCKVTNCTGC